MKLSRIHKVYQNKNGTVEALKGISIELNETGLIVVLGPSGCGKTTLLNIIAQKDTSFEGELSDVPRTVYLTQEVQLLESMTVEENLLLVNQNKMVIQEYLKKYNLFDHRNKKVLKCSHGQKKRVQFIRGLLVQPGLLLCDEPTAALDHENAEILMHDMKEISKTMQVILVTHDIALAETYADRIIKMEQGMIAEDTIFHSSKKSEQGQIITNQSLSRIVPLSIRNIISTPTQSLLWLIVAICSVFALSISTNLFQTTERSTNIHNAFKNAENLIISMPNKSSKRERWHDVYYGHIYPEYDYYYYQDIERLVAENKEIIGVEVFTSTQYDDNVLIKYVDNVYHTRSERSQYEFAAPGYKSFNIGGITTSSGDLWVMGNQPKDSPFLWTEKEEGLEGFYRVQSTYDDMKTYPLSVFDLVNDFHDIPLLFGRMPKENNEIVLDRNAADLVLKLNGFTELPELIDRSIPIGVLSERSNYYDLYPEEIGEPAELINVTISGVSSLQSEFMNMVFVNQGIKHNPILNQFIADYDTVFFHYVRFLVAPSSNVEKIVERLNTSLPMKHNTFIRFEGEGLATTKAYYRSPALFLTYGIGAIIALGGVFVVIQLFLRKKMRKEAQIFQTFGYLAMGERVSRLLLLYGVAILTCLLLFVPVVKKINEIAKTMYYDRMMSYQPVMIFLLTILIAIFHILLETVFCKERN